jgi:HlyD family secretion protein
MTRKLLIVFFILALIVLVPVVKNRLGEGNIKEVETESLQVRGIQTSVLASGTLAHEEEVLLSTEEIGKVTAIHVKEGDRVAKGQLLLQIDDEVFQAAVEQNRASVRMQEIAIERQQLRVENLQKQWERKQAIFERKLLDEDAFEIATKEEASAVQRIDFTCTTAGDD